MGQVTFTIVGQVTLYFPAGIRLEDARYIDLYADYTRLLDHGEKVSYAVAVLSEKYSVSERKVYALVKRFQSDCKTLAV